MTADEKAASISVRLRDAGEPNAFILRRRAADRIELLEALIAAADELPLWRLEAAAIPDAEFEAVTRFRAALYLAEGWTPPPEEDVTDV